MNKGKFSSVYISFFFYLIALAMTSRVMLKPIIKGASLQRVCENPITDLRSIHRVTLTIIKNKTVRYKICLAWNLTYFCSNGQFKNFLQNFERFCTLAFYLSSQLAELQLLGWPLLVTVIRMCWRALMDTLNLAKARFLHV